MVEDQRRYDEEYSVEDFTEYVKANLCWSPKQSQLRRHGCVFWNSDRDESFPFESNESRAIQQKVKLLMLEIAGWNSRNEIMVQFWAPEMDGNSGKSCLTTSNQPFVLDSLWKGMCWYRKICMENKYFLDQVSKDDEIGPPVRVFQKGYPESTPDLGLYSPQQYSLRDHATRYGLRGYMALPVFDLPHNKCIGILEVVSFRNWLIILLESIELALKGAGLRSSHGNYWPCLFSGGLRNLNVYTFPSIVGSKAHEKLEFIEIKEMLDLVIKLPQLCLAQVSIPCSQCANSSTILSCMEPALFVSCDEKNYWDFDQFLLAMQFLRVQTGQGLSGRVISSKTLCFCRNLCDFSITEFPLAHYAKEAKLVAYFAICLQSILTENILYLVEFFTDDWSFLHSLLPILEMKLKSFNFAKGQQLGEKLRVEVIELYKGDEHNLIEIEFPKLHRLKFEVTHEMEHQPSEIQRLNFASDVLKYFASDVEVIEQNNINAAPNLRKESETKKAKIERNKISFHISYDVLEPHFGCKLEDVAKKLGVSKSTLKRACRDCGIHRWPSDEKNKQNPRLFKTTKAKQRSGSKPRLSSSPLSRKNVSHESNVKNREHAITMLQEDENIVIIKAKFQDDLIKFRFGMSSRMEELEEQVARKLKLNTGSFKLKYLDEDEQWILLTCNEDLQLCLITLTSLGKTPIQLLVQMIGN